MRWLYHATTVRDLPAAGEVLAPESLAREGFVHTSYRDDVAESARLYLPGDEPHALLRIDPRRLRCEVDVAQTPRGPMPHVIGAVDADAYERLDWSALPSAPDHVENTRFGVVAFEGMTLLDLIALLDPLERLGRLGVPETSSVEVVSCDGTAVWNGCGLEVRCGRVRPPLAEFDVVVFPGGRGAHAKAKDATVRRWLSNLPATRMVASVCTGAHFLGALGRLEGETALTHPTAMDALAEYGACPGRGRVVTAPGLVTGGGVSCGIDVGLALVEWLAGPEARRKVAEAMSWPMDPRG